MDQQPFKLCSNIANKILQKTVGVKTGAAAPEVPPPSDATKKAIQDALHNNIYASHLSSAKIDTSNKETPVQPVDEEGEASKKPKTEKECEDFSISFWFHVKGEKELTDG